MVLIGYIQNVSRSFQNYVDYHKCIAAKGEEFAPCKQFLRAYHSLCPSAFLSRCSSAVFRFANRRHLRYVLFGVHSDEWVSAISFHSTITTVYSSGSVPVCFRFPASTSNARPAPSLHHWSHECSIVCPCRRESDRISPHYFEYGFLSDKLIRMGTIKAYKIYLFTVGRLGKLNRSTFHDLGSASDALQTQTASYTVGVVRAIEHPVQAVGHCKHTAL